ncbi:hypothetical protein D3C72_1262940 [compost metagenome]
MAGGLVGLELGLAPLVDDHPDHAVRLVAQVHGVEREVTDGGIHHNGVGYRIAVDAAALVHVLAMHDLAFRRQAGVRVNGGGDIQIWDISQDELIQYDRLFCGQARLPILFECVGNDLAHQDSLRGRLAPKTC